MSQNPQMFDHRKWDRFVKNLCMQSGALTPNFLLKSMTQIPILSRQMNSKIPFVLLRNWKRVHALTSYNKHGNKQKLSSASGNGISVNKKNAWKLTITFFVLYVYTGQRFNGAHVFFVSNITNSSVI